MKKGVMIIVGVIMLLLISSIVHEALQPKPFRWNPSIQSYDRQPYGAFVFFDELTNFFPGKMVEQLGKADLEIYQLSDQMSWETAGYLYDQDTVLYYDDFKDDLTYKEFNVICLADNFYIDELSARAMLQHVYQGNDALVSANIISYNLLKYLDIEIETPELVYKTESAIQDLFNIELYGKKYELRPVNQYTKLIRVPEEAEVIAKGKNGDILGVKFELGEGTVTLFTMPIVFSNYYVLKEDFELAETLTLKLPNEDTKWSNYLRGQYRHDEEKRSLMDYIHQQESLTWAFYILLFSVLIYFGLQVSRVQRAVPVLEAPSNDALKFVDTISNLYYLKKDHKAMMEMKMSYFLEWVRGTYHMDTHKIDEAFITKLANQSGVSEEDVGYVFKTYDQFKKKSQLTDAEFLRFNKLLQKFK